MLCLKNAKANYKPGKNIFKPYIQQRTRPRMYFLKPSETQPLKEPEMIQLENWQKVWRQFSGEYTQIANKSM